MENGNIYSLLEVLEQKVQLLSEKYALSQIELGMVREENTELKGFVKKQNAQINNFQNQYKISKIVAKIAPDAKEAAELRDKLDEYINETEKCITFLSK